MLDQLLTIIILSLIQGLAEWLPISSTAHLRIAEHILGLQATPLFNIFLHVGTLIVVILYFRRDVKLLLTALLRRDFNSEYGRLIPLIVVASIPTGIIGILYDKFLADTSQTILVIGITLLAGAILLFLSRFGKEDKTIASNGQALLIGAAQGAAVFPGFSRSGASISSGLLVGLKREVAFKFSFLLSIPAIGGDLIVEAYLERGNFISEEVGVSSLSLLLALILTMAMGYMAIALVRKLVLSKRFHYFSIYTFSLGIAMIILASLGF